MRCPSEVIAKSVTPRSTPTAAPVAGSGTGSATSTARDTYQRPSGSLDTVTVDGSILAGSTSGQDHTITIGSVIFASHNWPLRHRNAERVYSAACRAVRDLNLG